MKISNYTAEAGHWYTKQGEPAYTIVGKNGKERPTTLRDAREKGYVPSVTMIIREAAKPGLENWKQDQVLLAALTLPRVENELEKEFIARVKEDAKQQAIKAAGRGTEIHAWIQKGFLGEFLTGDALEYFRLVALLLHETCEEQDWIVEKSFATNFYGGKIDLHCDDYLFDIKTKETIADAKIWDEHLMQLAAYQRGIGHRGKAGIIFVSTTALEVKIEWIDETVRGVKMFDALTDYYYARTGL